ncbi:hypothetical protein CR513_11169, partial [Mucuna pruriens]
MVKPKVSSKGLYISLPIPTSPWVNIFMDFVLGLPRFRGGKDLIFMVVDKFSKMTYFIPCHKGDDACHMTNCFLRNGEQNFTPTLEFYEKESEILGRMIPHIEFLYNKVVHKTTSHTPFELVYGFNPLSPLDLLPLPGMAFIVH